MKIDWKRKLTSRKFWAALAGFVSMLIVAIWHDGNAAQTVTGLIMSGASLIAYIIGEGLADAGHADVILGESEEELVREIGFKVENNG